MSKFRESEAVIGRCSSKKVLLNISQTTEDTVKTPMLEFPLNKIVSPQLH